MREVLLLFVMTVHLASCAGSSTIAGVGPEVVDMAPNVRFVSITAGGQYTCAVSVERTVYCWGRNDFAQLGRGLISARGTPGLVPGLSGILGISGSINNTCASNGSGELFCWGGTSNRSINDAPGFGTSPVRIPTLRGVRAFASGVFNACAVESDFSTSCWGYFQLDETYAPPTDRGGVRRLRQLGGAIAVSAGADFLCVAYTNGRVGCLGNGVSRFLERTTGSAYLELPTLRGVVALSSMLTYVCSLTNTGQIFCWGSAEPQTPGTNGHRLNLQSIPLPSPATQVSAGAFHACALVGDGDVWCWGSNDYGQLGIESSTPSAIPVRVSLPSKARQVATGVHHTCALLNDASLMCWGRGDEGALGVASATERQFQPINVLIHRE